MNGPEGRYRYHAVGSRQKCALNGRLRGTQRGSGRSQGLSRATVWPSERPRTKSSTECSLCRIRWREHEVEGAWEHGLEGSQRMDGR